MQIGALRRFQFGGELLQRAFGFLQFPDCFIGTGGEFLLLEDKPFEFAFQFRLAGFLMGDGCFVSGDFLAVLGGGAFRGTQQVLDFGDFSIDVGVFFFGDLRSAAEAVICSSMERDR